MSLREIAEGTPEGGIVFDCSNKVSLTFCLCLLFNVLSLFAAALALGGALLGIDFGCSCVLANLGFSAFFFVALFPAFLN